MKDLFENWRKYQESADEEALTLEMKEFFDTADQLLMLNEVDFKKFFQGLPDAFKKKWDLFKQIAAEGKMKITQVVAAFKAKGGFLYKLLSAVGWSFNKISEALLKAKELYERLQNIVNELIKSNPALHAALIAGRAKVEEIDAWLDENPDLKQLAGLAVGGLLLLIWLNMSFTGDLEYDFGAGDMLAAFAGDYSLSDLFLSESGIRMLTLLATGVFLSGGMPWLAGVGTGAKVGIILAKGMIENKGLMAK
tara:strand:+ start:437 stop:1189 length:753 start_codon:yes stop_codon:yes gene_type:complete